MKALYDKGFPTPTPIDVNRHCVLMSLSHAYQLNSIAVLRHPGRVFSALMELIVRLAGVGLIHCDRNEFNPNPDPDPDPDPDPNPNPNPNPNPDPDPDPYPDPYPDPNPNPSPNPSP